MDMANDDKVSSDVKHSKTENEPLLGGEGFPSCRLVLAFMGVLGFINMYCLRFNLSVALVAMVNHTQQAPLNYSEYSSDDICQSNESIIATQFGKEGMEGGEFNWDSYTQAAVLAAFFYGYLTTQVIGGWLAERIGGKILFGGGILVEAGLTLLTPVAARCSVYLLIAMRVMAGVSEGVSLPSMYALLSRWIPPIERSRAVTFLYAGHGLGAVIGTSVSGVLCDYGFAGGWPSVFYVFGVAGCLWSLAWFLLCHNSPSTHPRISVSERQYIEKSMESCETSVKPPTPWMKIATSLPVWACATAHFAGDWGLYTMLTCLPMYMRDVLQFYMTQNGVLSALPYIANCLVLIGGGHLADWLRAPHRMQTTTVRKLFCAAGLLLPAMFLIAVGFLGCNRILIVSAVVSSVGSSGLVHSGFGANHLDLAPNYAGTLMGLTNTLATVAGILGPELVGALIYRESTRAQWQKFFYITATIYGFGAAIFVVFGSGKLQDWAVVPETQTGAAGRHNEEHNTRQGIRDASKTN